MENITWCLLQEHRDKGLRLFQQGLILNENSRVSLTDYKGNEITAFEATDGLALTHIWQCATECIKYHKELVK